MSSLSSATIDSFKFEVCRTIASEHRMAEQCLHDFRSAVDHEGRRRAAFEFIKLISVHSSCEERVIYPKLASLQASGKSLSERSVKEHDEAKVGLYALDQMDPLDRGYLTKFEEVWNLLATHIAEEESEVLPFLESQLSQQEADALLKDFNAAKATAPTRPHPMAPSSGIAAKVLHAMTKPLDVLRDTMSGRSATMASSDAGFLSSSTGAGTENRDLINDMNRGSRP